MRALTTIMAAGACTIVMACSGTGENTAQRADTSTVHDAENAVPDAHRDTAPAHDTAHAAAPGQGLPLLPIMQKLGADMAALTHALMMEDWPRVATSARDIAGHTPIAQEDVERIHRILGDDMAEFERLDTGVHNASVHLQRTAEAGNMVQVVERLGVVQRGCMECHARFRAKLRTNTRQ